VASDDQLIAVRVRPRSSRSCVKRDSAGRLVVCVHAAAAEGAANKECVAVLAKALTVAKSTITIVTGQRGRSKQIVVEGMAPREARARLELAASGERRKK
jgi:uncharacterized protein (TIGR00251 family)